MVKLGKKELICCRNIYKWIDQKIFKEKILTMDLYASRNYEMCFSFLDSFIWIYLWKNNLSNWRTNITNIVQMTKNNV